MNAIHNMPGEPHHQNLRGKTEGPDAGGEERTIPPPTSRSAMTGTVAPRDLVSSTFIIQHNMSHETRHLEPGHKDRVTTGNTARIRN